MTHRPQHATIIGAGIAGLTAGIALRRLGWSVTIHEATPSIQAAGAGLTLAANAMQALDSIGLADAVKRGGQIVRHMQIRDQNGQVLSDIDPTFLPAPMVAIHRATLHQILQEAVGKENIKTGQRIKDTASMTMSSDIVIIADGIHSASRRALVPDSLPRYAGYTCWRAVVHAPHIHLDAAVETWGPNGRFGLVPLGNGQIYWFACKNAEQEAVWAEHMSVQGLIENFSGYHDPIIQVLRATRNEDLLWNDISDIEPLQRWVYGRRVIIGDAAHATTPNLGQGACQAIEDAVMLAHELSLTRDIDHALRSFENARIDRTTDIVRVSRRMGALAQSTNPFFMWLRNLMMRLMPRSVQQRQLRDVCTFQLSPTSP